MADYTYQDELKCSYLTRHLRDELISVASDNEVIDLLRIPCSRLPYYTKEEIGRIEDHLRAIGRLNDPYERPPFQGLYSNLQLTDDDDDNMDNVERELCCHHREQTTYHRTRKTRSELSPL